MLATGLHSLALLLARKTKASDIRIGQGKGPEMGSNSTQNKDSEPSDAPAAGRWKVGVFGQAAADDR